MAVLSGCALTTGRQKHLKSKIIFPDVPRRVSAIRNGDNHMDTVAVVAAETGKVAMKQDVWRDPMVVATFLLVVATFLLVVATFLLVLIALKQHRTSHDQIRVDLFDKRHRIFRVLMDLIRKIGGGEPIGNAETWDFLDCRNEAVFLFTGDRDMEEYLKDFFHNLKTLACCYAQLNAPTE